MVFGGVVQKWDGRGWLGYWLYNWWVAIRFPANIADLYFFPKRLVRFWGSPSLRLVPGHSRKGQDDWVVKLTPDLHVVSMLLGRSVPVFLLICIYKVRGDNFYVTESCRNFTDTAREDGLLLQHLLGLCLEERGFQWHALAGSFCCPIPSCNSIFMISTLSPPQRVVRCFI